MAESRRITVSTADVARAGNNIANTHAPSYKTTYATMFGIMEGLNGTWNGTDFSEYSKRAQSFKKDFEAMYSALIDYANYLVKAAKAYETAQNNVISDAKSRLKM